MNQPELDGTAIALLIVIALFACVLLFYIFFYEGIKRRRLLKTKESEGNDEGSDSVAAETYKLNAELISKGVPAKAKILKIWDEQQFEREVCHNTLTWSRPSPMDGSKNLYLLLEIHRGDDEPYQVGKYRPWLPEWSPDPEELPQKPYYWNFRSDEHIALEEGKTFPVRVHPEIPDLIDFEINFYERDAMPQSSTSRFVFFEEMALRVSYKQNKYPVAFAYWQEEISSQSGNSEEK